jgi:hypothetical protein
MLRTRSGVRGAFVGKYKYDLQNDGKDCACGSLRLLLRATPVDLRKPISAWAASTHVGEPSNYGRGKYLISVLVQGRRQCTMSPSTAVRTLRMSSWRLGQRLFWALQEVSGHCIYGHETRNRSCGCIVWASWRLTTCELSYLFQENPYPRPIFGQRVLGQIRRTTGHEKKQAIGFSLLYDHPVCVSCI